jgi:hypothetical protein
MRDLSLLTVAVISQYSHFGHGGDSALSWIESTILRKVSPPPLLKAVE